MQWQLAWFLATWMFYFGACVGSFMNVVIYRLPAGMKLWKPNSRCPQCLHAIRWRDNLPIISWMNLGAKCRDCHVPIPARYPFVELLMGAVFLCIGVFEGVAVGRNLPTVIDSIWATWFVMAAHLTLLCVLVCAAFIEFDGNRPPAKLFLFAIVIGQAAVMIEPAMVPHSELGFAGNGLLTMLVGLAAGALIGLAVSGAGNSHRGGWTAILPWAVTGQFLGWQAICWLTILTTILVALRALTRGSLNRAPTTGLLAAVTVPWLVCWSATVTTWPTWTAEADASLLAIATMFAISIAAIEYQRAPSRLVNEAERFPQLG